MKQLKRTLFSFLPLFLLIALFFPHQKVYAGNEGYALGIAPDFNRFMYLTTVNKEDHDWNQGNFSEFKSLNVPSGFSEKIPEALDGGWKRDFEGKGKHCMFLFPACGSKQSEKGPDGKDNAAVNRIVMDVIAPLNEAISFVLSNTEVGGKPYRSLKLSESEKKEDFVKITAQLGNAANGTDSTLEFRDDTFSLSRDEGEGKMKISKGNKSVTLRYISDKYSAEDVADRAGSFPEISWFHVVWFGNASALVREDGLITADNIGEFGNPGFVTMMLTDFLDGVLNTLKGFLGLYSISDIVFNEGNFESTYWNGIAPESWFQAGNILYWICQALAWTVVVLAIVLMFGQGMYKTLTPHKRFCMINGMKDMAVAAVMMGFFPAIFILLSRFNVLLVDIMANLTIFNDNISVGSVGGGTIAGVILSFLFFGVEIYFNFTYILRGITIILLYGLAPMFIITYTFGDKFKSITFKYYKELIGNIFIHTFHATFLMFYGIFINTSVSGFFVQLVLLYAFIPMTKLFKSLTGIGESDFISSTANQAKETVKSTGLAVAGGAVGGLVAGSMMKGKAGKGGPTGPTGGPTGPTGDPSDSTGGGGGGGSTPEVKGSLADGFSGSKTGVLMNKAKNAVAGSPVGKAYNATKDKVSGAYNTAKNTVAGSAVGQLYNNAKNSDWGQKVSKGANALGNAVTSDKAKSLYKGTAKTIGRLGANGVKMGIGAGLAAAGGLTGAKGLTHYGQKVVNSGASSIGGTVRSGVDNTVNAAKTVSDKIRSWNNIQTDNEGLLNRQENENGTMTDSYYMPATQELNGVEDMAMFKDGDNTFFQQVIDQKNLSPELKEMIDNGTDSTGKVTNDDLRAGGLDSFSYSEKTGKYTFNFDAKKFGINDVKRSGNKRMINCNGDKGLPTSNLLNHIHQDINSKSGTPETTTEQTA